MPVFLEISIALGIIVVAVSFAILVFRLLRTLKNVDDSLNQVKTTLADVQERLFVVTDETLVVLKNTQDITSDVNEKINAMNGVFQSVSQVGDAIGEVTSSFKEASATVSRSLIRNVEQVDHKLNNKPNQMAEVVDWANILMQVWRKLRKPKKDELK